MRGFPSDRTAALDREPGLVKPGVQIVQMSGPPARSQVWAAADGAVTRVYHRGETFFMPTKTRKTTSGSRAVRGATSPARGKATVHGTTSSARKGTKSHANSQGKGAATPAGKSLDRSLHALDQAADTEKQLRAALKKHDKAVRAAKTDLERRDRDLQAMKSQLKTAKKSRKRAAKAIG
jgi:hypothetical protein